MTLFSKYSGAGNDFVIVRAEEFGLGDAGELARRICPRARGVGVDGLILVRGLTEELVRVRFFNPDGSEFSTCGNGSRCAARYAVDRGLVGPEHVLVTDDGEIVARVGEGRVALEYALDAAVLARLPVMVEGASRTGWLVRMGTPHLVVPLDSVEVADFDEVCRPLRHLAEAGPEGANVNLVALDDDAVSVRTFERGVEGETGACGSGCMAVALALRGAGRVSGPVTLATRSGARLTVEFLEADRIRLDGPAEHVFDGVFPDP